MAEGSRLVGAALGCGAEVEGVYVAAGREHDAALWETLERAQAAGVRVHELAPGVMERVADTVTPQPVLAVVRMPETALGSVEQSGFVVVCVDVRDPGNAGAIIRLADAAGADAVVCCDGTVDPFNPKTVRASAGSVLHVPVVVGGEPAVVLDALGRAGLRRLAAAVRGGIPYTEAPLEPPLALVLGNEATGLPVAAAAHLDGAVTIPMAGGAESLNVAMAAAVLCFEVQRRRSNMHAMKGLR
ncbi:MAG TPA: RNA methyltransferase [Acidimicrobiales bacterium]|nr:RNA methyltransferase [Acidimicrobiales bacterium]